MRRAAAATRRLRLHEELRIGSAKETDKKSRVRCPLQLAVTARLARHILSDTCVSPLSAAAAGRQASTIVERGADSVALVTPRSVTPVTPTTLLVLCLTWLGCDALRCSCLAAARARQSARMERIQVVTPARTGTLLVIPRGHPTWSPHLLWAGLDVSLFMAIPGLLRGRHGA